MADSISRGALAPGERLPPHRELAYQLGVSANTTSRAYAEAVRRGLLRGEVGRGTFVRGLEAQAPGDSANTLLRKCEGPIDLSRNLPFPGFAEPHIRHVLGEISSGPALSALLDYQNETDLGAHAEAGCAWLAQCGVPASPEEVVATVGAQHALFIVLSGLLKRGDLLLTESLTYMPVLAMAERLGLYTAQVEMDDGGILPESVEALCKTARPRALYLSPTLQAPTTITLPDERRVALAEIALRHDLLLIEDDVFGPLKPDRPAPIATRAPEKTLYITSLSKAVAPGLRVGFVRAPARCAPALRHAVNLTAWMAPPLTLEVASRLIHGGTASTLAMQQRGLATQRKALARAVLGDTTGRADPSGLHLWLPLPEGMRADSFCLACARRDVLVTEARSFAADASRAPEAVRMCLSHEPNEARVEKGLSVIADLLREPSSVQPLSL